MHKGADVFALKHTAQIAHFVHVENVDGQIVLLAHGCGRDVHDAQAALQHFVVWDLMKYMIQTLVLTLQ